MRGNLPFKHRELMEYLYRHQTAKVSELSRALYLSESTVRRVLTELERSGKLLRYHGGAALAAPEDSDSFFKRREVSNLHEKDAIGRKAASFVKEGMTLLLMGGTTVRALCPYLRGRKLTVITSSLPVMNDLAWEEKMQIILLGGVLNPPEMEVRGELTQTSLEHLRADIMFTGTTGLHPIHGVMTDDPNGVDAYTTCMRISDQVIVLADHSKCERFAGTSVICGFARIDCLIVDDGIPSEVRAFYQSNMRRMEIAECDS